MSTAETSKLMDVTSDIVTKLIREIEDQRKKALEMNQKISEHGDQINSFIDQEKSITENNESGLSKEQIESVLNDHFEKIEGIVHENNIADVDIDSFKKKMDDLADNFKDSVKHKANITKKTKGIMTLKNIRNFAKEKVNDFVNKVNDQVVTLSNKLNNKINERDQERKNDQKIPSYEEKIENTLRNNPQLLKDTALVTQLNSMSKHIEESTKQLEELQSISREDPIEQYKLNDMKNKLSIHISHMENKVSDLQSSHGQDKSLEKLSNQLDDSHEKDRTPKEEKSEKEVILER